MRRLTGPLLAFISGLAFFALSAALTATREPWDDARYWLLGYPAALVAFAGTSFYFPNLPRRFLLPLLFFQAQLVGQGLRSGEIGSRWPLGVAMFAFVSLPCTLAMRLAAHLSPYRKGSPA